MNCAGPACHKINTSFRCELGAHPCRPEVAQDPAAQWPLLVAQILGHVVLQILVLQVGDEVVDGAD